MSEQDTPPVAAALDDFVTAYLRAFPRLEDYYDPDWRSPAEVEGPWRDADGTARIAWRPVRRPPDTHDFAGLENALEVPVHPDIRAYYGRYWSGGLEAEAPDGHVSLLLLWNQQDVDRLVENLIGHALAQRRARTGFSVFFACTEPESDLFLTVHNATGRVLLEAPGRKPLRTVADSLAEFLQTLRPAAPELHPERPS